jgi:CheY-like chemotaxis protein
LYILKALRSQEKYKQIPIVLYSDTATQQDVSIASSLLASAFLQKPYDIEILRQVVKTGWGWPHSPPPIMQTKEHSR